MVAALLAALTVAALRVAALRFAARAWIASLAACRGSFRRRTRANAAAPLRVTIRIGSSRGVRSVPTSRSARPHRALCANPNAAEKSVALGEETSHKKKLRLTMTTPGSSNTSPARAPRSAEATKTHPSLRFPEMERRRVSVGPARRVQSAETPKSRPDRCAERGPARIPGPVDRYDRSRARERKSG